MSRNVTDYEVEIKIGDVIQSRTVLNSLKVGEKVLMLRKSGGQEYIIIDRVVN